MQEALVEYLGLVDDLVVCGVAGSAEQAMQEMGSARPSVLLLDLSLPGRSGLELLTILREDSSLPCLILSGHGERSHIRRAFDAGANGYLVKGKPRELVAAIRVVADGGTYRADAKGA